MNPHPPSAPSLRSGRRIRHLPSAICIAFLILACDAPANAPLVRVTVPIGAHFAEVTDSLVNRGLLESTFWFKAFARLRRTDRSVKAGVYDLPVGATSWALLSALEEGRVATVRFTVPEGLTLAELADLAQERLGLSSDTILALARDRTRVSAIAPDAPSLEGYLLPETYSLPVPATPAELVDAMLQMFQQQWDPAWDARLRELQLTRTQILALASIVEGEARHDDERTTIAGVYSNRLRIGMPLQADPTVQYAIAQKTGVRKKRLYYKDYAFSSPYNTYLNPGLPPGPVNSPGLNSIRAALFPADVPYIFFVAKPDGHHLFSRTLAEHNRNIAQVRRGAARTTSR
jgi:UPF0755 protein